MTTDHETQLRRLTASELTITRDLATAGDNDALAGHLVAVARRITRAAPDPAEPTSTPEADDATDLRARRDRPCRARQPGRDGVPALPTGVRWRTSIYGRLNP